MLGARAALLTALFTLAVLAPALAAPARAELPTVIVLSWDGTRWDYPDRAGLPALERMAREGARAERMVPVFPTSTFPNHVALATGTYVDRHGIVSNVFRDPERGMYRYSDDADFIEAEPVWIAAERQGVRAATFFWVGSEGDWRGERATHRVAPFDSGIPEARKVDQILAWLDLPPDVRPRLVLSWWHGADHVGHSHGPDDAAVTEQLRLQDIQLGRLLQGLDERGAWAHTTLIVLSDHGMARVDRRLDPLGPLAERGIGARLNPGGGSAYLRLDDPTRLDEALRVLAGVEGLEAFSSRSPPPGLRSGHPTRTGHVTLIAEPPFALAGPSRSRLESLLSPVRRLFGGSRGMHGYRPEHPDMHAIFFALGRDVGPGRSLGRLRTIDVAPTVTRLLGIDPPSDAEGSPIDLGGAALAAPGAGR